jgi:AraC family ethanolamine operon transcriptional activator
MTLTPPLSRLQTFHCRDITEQASVLKAWNQSYCQLSPGVFDGSVTEIDTGAVRVLVERINRTVFQRGALPRGCIAVGVPLVLEGHALLCGQRSHVDGLHVFSGGDGFEFLSPEQHLVVDIEFYTDRFESPALQEVLQGIEARIGRHAVVLDFAPERMQALRLTLRVMLGSVAANPGLLDHPLVCRAFEKTLVYALSELLEREPCGDSGGATPLSRSWRLTQTARSCVEQTPSDCPLSVAELVATLGVSRRTLQYAFQDAMGVSPASYLRVERLNRVRQALRDADSVTEAATRLGFWHFGHFATEYRALFHELPSDTFRRYRKGAVHAEPDLVSSVRPARGWLC